MIKDDISRNILISRKILGYKHEDLCLKTGLTRPIISKVESGRGNPTIDTIIKIRNELKISSEMLIMSEMRFNHYLHLLKPLFQKEKMLLSELMIDPQMWKKLLKCSGDSGKLNCGKVAKMCSEVIQNNYEVDLNNLDVNIVLGATLGVIFQEDGFMSGLEFGAWLGGILNQNI